MGPSGKRGAARIEMSGDVLLFPIAGGKSRPAEMAEVCDLSRSGAALIITASPELTAGRTLALRLVTANGRAALLLHCEIRRTYPVDRARTRIGVRILRVLKDGRAGASPA